MRLAWLAAVAVALSACAFGSGRVDTLSRAPSFRAKVLAIAETRGAGIKGPEIDRSLERRAELSGLRASALADSDSVLAGSALSLDIAADPRVLAEISRATGADSIVFLALTPNWRALDVSVLDAATGDVILRATARPSGDSFESPDAVASAAAEALSGLAPRRYKAADGGDERPDEIAVPDVGEAR